MLPALVHIPANLGYLALAALVGAESGGLPVPGETALITASVLAQRGRLELVLVIAVAAGAAIAGDNVGFLLGRRLGRSLLERPGRLHARRMALLERADGLFARHGAKTVFFGRWIAGLRIWAAWLAGTAHMRWPRFLLWNALGGIAWATTVGVAGYLIGVGAERVFASAGAAVAIAVVVLVGGAWLVRRVRGGGTARSR
jgi:membrane protein DedA with SNARE-associated domain